MMFVYLLLVFITINIGTVSEANRFSDCGDFYYFYTAQNLTVLECKLVEIRVIAKYSTRYNHWPIAIEAPNEPLIYLNLRKIDGLTSKNTPIYFGNNNGTTDCATTYEKSTLKSALSSFNYIFMFQDYDSRAAITIFSDDNDNYNMEGFIGNYILRQTVDRKYILLKVTFPLSEIQNNEYMKYKKNDRFATCNLSSSVDAIDVKILVALDWTSIKQESVSQSLQNLLVYYNAVNMLFRPFISPKIKLILSGVIIPKNEYSSPYFSKNQFKSSNNSYINFNAINENMRKYFLSEQANVFPKDSFDIIIGMTNLPFCDIHYNCQYYGVSDQSVIYNSISHKNEPARIVGVVRHPHFQGSYAVVAREIAHILGSSYNTPYYAFDNCNGIMNKFVRPDEWPLEWSRCNIDDMSIYFSLNQSSGFYKRN
ncbi:uncharacterized protein LOC103574890 [Microplitis demolitor]|uniref:uncharacterized protein LOC103574890 n=1 Tax=Microplitis demolitor TaxID=69319 RepID=UPI00044000DF|nr:uncharacterized protein LOC103574890 [Microplitis demolitor]